MLTRTLHAIAFGLLAILTACAETTGAVLIEPIQIDGVEILILESAPPQVQAHVTGVIGDGCSELESVTQARAGNTVTVTILRRRDRDAFCTQIAKLYDETIALEGTFPAGEYVLNVNDFGTTFATQ
jgi:hypothetical protein